MKKSPRPSFENSAELKRLFNQLLEEWSRSHRLGLPDLAQRCGVSAQYLGHVGRYGRVPGKPILMLLALNFGMSDPGLLFKAAGLSEPWPLEPGLGLRPKGPGESGFLSLNLDMQGFAAAIREIVRSELRPKTVLELLAGRALRVGLNRGQDFFFADKGGKTAAGFFPELMQLTALGMHCDIEFSDVSHVDFAARLRSGEIDVFGPVYFTPHRMTQASFTTSFCTVRLGGVGRVRETSVLPHLPRPKKLSDLRKKGYRVAVHRESMSHHFALSELKIPPEQILPCDLPEETIERVLLSGIPRPAHLLLTDGPHAHKIHEAHPQTTELLFAAADPEIPPYEDTIAVRPDWPSVAGLLNETLGFLQRNGSIDRLFERTIDPRRCPGISLRG